MNKRLICILVIGGLAGGCAIGGPARVWKNTYTLPSMHANHTGAGAAPAAMRSAVLRIERVGAPAWLNSRDMYYQLDYSDDQRLSAYSESRWVASPPRLLEHLLREGTAGEWKAVVGPDNPAPADYTLQVYLLDFEQDFKNERHSDAVLSARVTLARNNPAAVVAQRSFAYRLPAPQPNAGGGAEALSRAGHRLVVSVDRWLEDIMAGHVKTR